MKFERRDVYFIVVVVVFIGFLSLFRFNLTGNVVWEPVTLVNNCTDSQILALWDEIFVESSGGVVILKNEISNCTSFIAYKSSGQKVFAILQSQVTSVEEETYSRLGVLQKINGSKEIVAIYSNLTQDSVNKFIGNMTDYPSAKNYLAQNLNSLEIYNWTIALSDAQGKYLSEFDTRIGNSFEDSYSSSSFSNAFAAEDSNQTLSFDKVAVEMVGKNQSFMQYYFASTTFYTIPLVNTTLKQNISNFTFEANSSWNYAFDINDTFAYGAGTSIGFEYVGGTDNLAGQQVNWSINGTKVYFMPASSYVGTKEFQLSAMGIGGTVYSNRFKVTIVGSLNERPILKTEFGQLFVPREGNLSVFLEDYFEDPDGDNLTFNTSKVENLTIIISGQKMTVQLKANFTDYEIFYVYASDGELSRTSNKIYVFEKPGTVTYTLVNKTEEPLLAEGAGIVSPSLEGNTSGNNTRVFGGGSLKIVFWSIGGVVLLGLLGVGGYLLYINNSPKPIVGPSPQVKTYLEEVVSKEPAESEKMEKEE